MDTRHVSHLRLVNADDAKFILRLRTDSELSRYLSPTEPTFEGQRAWIHDYKKRESEQREFYFIIIHRGLRVGTIRMYDFRGEPGSPGSSFEWGSWIIKKPRPPGLAVYSALCIYEIGFDVRHFDFARFQVRKNNQRVIDFYLRSHAETIQDNGEDVHFLYTHAAYERFRAENIDRICLHQQIYG